VDDFKSAMPLGENHRLREFRAGGGAAESTSPAFIEKLGLADGPEARDMLAKEEATGRIGHATAGRRAPRQTPVSEIVGTSGGQFIEVPRLSCKTTPASCRQAGGLEEVGGGGLPSSSSEDPRAVAGDAGERPCG